MLSNSNFTVKEQIGNDCLPLEVSFNIHSLFHAVGCLGNFFGKRTQCSGLMCLWQCLHIVFHSPLSHHQWPLSTVPQPDVGRYGLMQTGTCERGGNAVLGDGSRDGIDDHCATRRASQLTKPTLNPLLQPWGLWDLEKLENKAAAKMETTQVMLAIKNTCDRPAVQQAANLFAWFALCSIFQTWDGEGAHPANPSHL